MKNISLLLFAFFCSLQSFACLNGEHYMMKNGYLLYQDYEDDLPFGHEFYTHQFDQNIKQLDSLYTSTKDIAYLSDKGLILILQKKYTEALALYQSIEKMQPGRYSTASNMGTLYELMGDNKNALYWIKRSVTINPDSHEGSEWLHVKILEAKLKGEAYFTGAFLLDTDFGNATMPATAFNKTAISKLEKALYFQLNERTSFIKPNDKIIAILMFELANIKLLKHKYSDAIAIFDKAKEYGDANPLTDARIALAREAIKHLKKTTKSHSGETDYAKTFALAGAIFAVLAIGFSLLMRKKGNTAY